MATLTTAPTKRQLRVLDLTATTRPVSIDVDASPAYELLTALMTLALPEVWETCEIGDAWFEKYRTQIEPVLRDRSTTGDLPSCKEWSALAGLVREAPRRDDVDAVLDHLASLPAAAIVRSLVGAAVGGGFLRSQAELVDAAVAGDREAGERLLGSLPAEVDGEDVEADAVARLLTIDPVSVRASVLGTLREARRILSEHLDETAPVLLRDADALRARLRGLPIEDAVEVGTNGIAYAPEPGVRRVLIAPQVAMRPWVTISETHDTKVFLVAASDESLGVDRDAPSPRLVALCKALGEEQRLRILRRLTAGPASLQQITDHLGIAKSTAHHHMVALRAAGLTSTALGADKAYSLREGIVADVAELLDQYLRGGAPMHR